MGKVLITEQHLQDIADAIRSKNGSEETYTPGEMATAIEEIESGSSDAQTEITVPIKGKTIMSGDMMAAEEMMDLDSRLNCKKLIVIAMNLEADNKDLYTHVSLNNTTLTPRTIDYHKYSLQGSNKLNYRIDVYDILLSAYDSISINILNSNADYEPYPHSAFAYAFVDTNDFVISKVATNLNGATIEKNDVSGSVIYGTIDNINYSSDYHAEDIVMTSDPGDSNTGSFIIWLAKNNSYRKQVLVPDYSGLSHSYLAMDGSYRHSNEGAIYYSNYYSLVQGRTYAIFLGKNTSDRLRVQFYANKKYSDFINYINIGASSQGVVIYNCTTNITGGTEVTNYRNSYIFTPESDGELIIVSSRSSVVAPGYCVQISENLDIYNEIDIKITGSLSFSTALLSNGIINFYNNYAASSKPTSFDYDIKLTSENYGTTLVQLLKENTNVILEFNGYIYNKTEMINDLGLTLLGDFSQGGAATGNVLLDSIENYSAILLQGVYKKQMTSQYNTTMLYSPIKVNTPYWAGMKDRNTAYDCFVTFTDAQTVSLTGNKQVIIYGMP